MLNGMDCLDPLRGFGACLPLILRFVCCCPAVPSLALLLVFLFKALGHLSLRANPDKFYSKSLPTRNGCMLQVRTSFHQPQTDQFSLGWRAGGFDVST